MSRMSDLVVFTDMHAKFSRYGIKCRKTNATLTIKAEWFHSIGYPDSTCLRPTQDIWHCSLLTESVINHEKCPFVSETTLISMLIMRVRFILGGVTILAGTWCLSRRPTFTSSRTGTVDQEVPHPSQVQCLGTHLWLSTEQCNTASWHRRPFKLGTVLQWI